MSAPGKVEPWVARSRQGWAALEFSVTADMARAVSVITAYLESLEDWELADALNRDWHETHTHALERASRIIARMSKA